MNRVYRHGHIGIALLAYAPFAYALLKLGHPALALLCGIGVLIVEPLPDRDHSIPWLSHRGVSHSLLAMTVLGGVVAAIGWAFGHYGVEPLVRTLRGTPIITQTHTSIYLAELGRYDARTLAVIGFYVGAFGIFVHLLGDVITIYGIRPFLPVSRWRVSLSSLRAKSRVANTAFLIVGVVAIGAVIYAATPGVSVPQTPEHAVENATNDLSLSPVGTVAAASHNKSNDDESAKPSISFKNQTTNGSEVKIASATLPAGGYVVIHAGKSTSYETSIAVSGHISNGTHRNFTVPINRGVPGGKLNRSRLTNNSTLTAMLYHENNSNKRFEHLLSRDADTVYKVNKSGKTEVVASIANVTVTNSSSASDESATATTSKTSTSKKSTTTTTTSATTRSNTIPTSTRSDTIQNASVTFNDQETNGSALTIDRVSVPDGGWIVVNNRSYSSAPLRSAVGISRYLKPGEHEDVSVSLLSGSIPENQTLIARPSRDTNNNQQYDFVESNGNEDNGYVRDGEEVTDTANVTLTNAAAGLPTMSEENRNGSNGSFSVLNHSTATTATAIGDGGGANSATGGDGSSGDSSDSGGIGSLGVVWLVPLVIVALAILLYLYIRSQLP